MGYRVKRNIYQYSLLDLLEILQYSDHPEYNEAEQELKKRNPSEKELSAARMGLVYRNKTRNKPLSFVELLYCILTPLISNKHSLTGEDHIEESFDDQLAEYEYFNESRKVKQFKNCKLIVQFLYFFAIGAFVITLIVLFLIYGL
ncbi:hypothetical protein SLH46_06310 [Draconibacterium sp. IB214405]|uniref:hypothetical protein n=1 Tax=Draconibacterium sp. IB214405 TaxID=3097352 RepID=UPI002A0CC151|nr:hypothetical protein [Draconibacterium sp. IB214405]MDX8338785.1 hypothetical protein [Draconibacterium sp. IB214405]